MISNCFEIIDKNAKKVLESDEFEDISLELLEDIIRRDGLELSSGIMSFSIYDRGWEVQIFLYQ